MSVLTSLPLVLLLLILAPLGLLGAVGFIVLVLKIVAIFQKAAEPRTTDEGGHYSLEQSQDVGQKQ